MAAYRWLRSSLVVIVALAGGAAAWAADPPTTHINQTTFDIPFNGAAATRAGIQELILYVSENGRNWEQVAVSRPEKGAFTYTAPHDGVFIFSVVNVDARGNRTPADPGQMKPMRRVVVDTVKPDLHIVSVERVGDEVTVRWAIQDPAPNLATLKLTYRAPETPEAAATPVTVTTPEINGSVSFRPNTAGPIIVHMEVQDYATNLATASAEVKTVTTASAGVAPAPVPVMAAPSAPMGRDWSPAPTAPLPKPQPGWDSPGSVSMTNQNQQPVARTSNSVNSLPSGLPAASRISSEPPLYVNKKSVPLNFAVTAGSSGIGGVQLYVTRDDGRTWLPYGAELRADSSQSGLTQPGSEIRQTITVDLPDDGLYGFSVVAKSGVGLSKAPPQNGDPPMIRIEVDTKMPDAQLYRPVPDPAQKGTLLLEWAASDTNLTERPITLEWADRKSGTWHVIGERDMPNTGRYRWQLPTDVPGKVFLRLTVRDKANNLGIAETPEAERVDLVEPEVKFLGIGR